MADYWQMYLKSFRTLTKVCDQLEKVSRQLDIIEEIVVPLRERVESTREMISCARQVCEDIFIETTDAGGV